MDTYTSPQGVTFTMDTAERYPLSRARDMLAYQLGRKTAARTLCDARFRGPVTIGGTVVAYDQAAAAFTITDAPSDAEALRQHLSATEAHALYVAGSDLASMTRAELIREHDDMPVMAGSCRDCPSQYR